MGAWIAELIWIIPILILLPIIGLAIRRRWISRNGGIFDCSLRHPDGVWTRGLARYRGENIQWFPVFSAFFRPRYVFHRSCMKVTDKRVIDGVEKAQLYGDERVVVLNCHGEDWELSMDSEVMMGFLTWLEAAPPGLSYRRQMQ